MEKKTEMTVSLDVCVSVCLCVCGRETAPPSGHHSPGNIKAAKGPQALVTLHIKLFIGHSVSDEI